MVMSKLVRISHALLIAALLVVSAGASVNAAPAFDSDAPVVLITGSNRGIGLALARQFASEGWNVIATCRKPGKARDLQDLAAANPRVIIEQLDVTDAVGIQALAERYADTPIDVLLNNAGISGGMKNETLGALNFETFDRVMAVNAIAPVRIAEAFLEQVAASEQKKIMNISSSEGSVASVRGGRLYFYRSSKRALNMMMNTMAKELADREIVVGLLNPGFVDTDMTRGVAFQKLSPEQSARDLYQVIIGFDETTSGQFLNYDGEPIPW